MIPLALIDREPLEAMLKMMAAGECGRPWPVPDRTWIKPGVWAAFWLFALVWPIVWPLQH